MASNFLPRRKLLWRLQPTWKIWIVLTAHPARRYGRRNSRLQISQPADLRNGFDSLPSAATNPHPLPVSSGCRRRADTPRLLRTLSAYSRARRPTRMHAPFTQVFSSHVMGRVPLVRFSRPFAARVNPSQGHLSSIQSTRAISARVTSPIPVNLSHLLHPVRYLWSRQQHRPRSLQGFADAEEAAIRVGILETVHKGRQPGDMMLRCNCLSSPRLPQTSAIDHEL